MLISYIKKLLLRLPLKRKAILRARWIYKLVGNKPSRKTGGKTDGKTGRKMSGKMSRKISRKIRLIKDDIVEYTILDD